MGILSEEHLESQRDLKVQSADKRALDKDFENKEIKEEYEQLHALYVKQCSANKILKSTNIKQCTRISTLEAKVDRLDGIKMSQIDELNDYQTQLEEGEHSADEAVVTRNEELEKTNNHLHCIVVKQQEIIGNLIASVSVFNSTDSWR